MKKYRKGLCLLLVLAMGLGMSACGGAAPGESAPPVQSVQYADPYAQYADHDSRSAAIYADMMGEFYAIYEQAKAADNVSRRWALMAVAEAKLLTSGALLPLTGSGGSYAISRVAPYTAPYALWGNDDHRCHSLLVTTKPINGEHREEMKAQWVRLRGTGTYAAWAEQYLTGKGYSLKDSYTLGYSSDPQSWDVLTTAKAADAEAIVNTYDGLYEYDGEGTLQPALALSHTVTDNADGTQTWSFTLRRGVKWVDYQGRQIGEVTADDFVAGMQHMLDSGSDLGYLAYEAAKIVGAYDYYSGSTADFDHVGVKAADTYTVAYTLEQPCPFFDTMLGYNVFAPMNRAYYESKGGGFGGAYTESAAYGTSPENIAYCGPYLVSGSTAESMIVFTANPSYWNAENIRIKTVTWLFNDGTDELKAYNDCMAGTLDGTGLNANAVVKAKTDGVFDELHYISPSGGTTFFAFHNLNRVASANFNDATAAVSPKTAGQFAAAKAAMYNRHFRLALCMALDRGAYNAQSVGEDLKLTSLRNTFTPGSFVSLKEEVTIELDGVSRTYPAGTMYGQIMQDAVDADGIGLTLWDPAGEAGIGSSDGFDGWYSPDSARKQLRIAVSQLKEQGLEISRESPVYIDLPYFAGSSTYTNRANAYKQSVEAALEGLVRVNLVPCRTSADAYYAGYYITHGGEANYDVYDYSGWGPDYGDPQAYLDTVLPDYSGYMTMMLGIF